MVTVIKTVDCLNIESALSTFNKAWSEVKVLSIDKEEVSGESNLKYVLLSNYVVNIIIFDMTRGTKLFADYFQDNHLREVFRESVIVGSDINKGGKKLSGKLGWVGGEVSRDTGHLRQVQVGPLADLWDNTVPPRSDQFFGARLWHKT